MDTPATYITHADMETIVTNPAPPSAEELAALERLISIAKKDTGQARRVAEFLLAWWNAGSCGGFDLTNLWAVDTAIAKDMTTVFALVARVHSYPESGLLKYGPDFLAIVREWRPELLTSGRED